MKKLLIEVLVVIVAAVAAVKLWIVRASRPFDTAPLRRHGGYQDIRVNRR